MDKTSLNRVLETIKKRTSRSTVAEYLRGKGLPHSAANWDELIDNRIRSALKDKKLTDQDIRILLREAEDYGKQHVFLYEPSTANTDPRSLVDVQRVKRLLKNAGLADLVDTVKVVGMPAKIEIVDVHFGPGYLSVKFVEPRSIELEEREETSDGYYVKKISKRVRVVDIVTLFNTGLLEFRIGTQEGTKDYLRVVNDLWSLLKQLIPNDKFREKELVGIRRSFTINPSDTVKKLVRIRSARGQDGDGNKYVLAVGRPSGNLLGSDNVVEGIRAIAGGRRSRPGATAVGFLKQPGGFPNRELGVIFSSRVNEYIVSLNCTRQEHEYIRGHITKYTK